MKENVRKCEKNTVSVSSVFTQSFVQLMRLVDA